MGGGHGGAAGPTDQTRRMDDLSGRTAVITGAASGIGLALARRFAEAGMNLVLGDVEDGPLDAVVAELSDAGTAVVGIHCDVSDLDDIRALEAAARERFGNVHVLCNNAGVGSGGLIAEPDDLDLWKWVIDVNLWGVIYGCKVFLPAMIEHGEGAHIVNTASMAGHASAPLMGPYNVSKYGVVALSETLAKEMQMTGTGIGVSVLCPAFVQTAIGSSRRNMPDELKAEQGPAGVERHAVGDRQDDRRGHAGVRGGRRRARRDHRRHVLDPHARRGEARDHRTGASDRRGHQPDADRVRLTAGGRRLRTAAPGDGRRGRRSSKLVWEPHVTSPTRAPVAGPRRGLRSNQNGSDHHATAVRVPAGISV